ncbi:MAG: putative salt-induced outer membrane protein YdiY [Moritella dasanensis]|jgi:putative salt-induced outer membrane protein YdiY
MNSFNIITPTKLTVIVISIAFSFLSTLFSVSSFAAQEIILGDYIKTPAPTSPDESTSVSTNITDNSDAVTTTENSQEVILADSLGVDEDWLWLKSGEFLIGNIEDLYDEKMAFDSDDLGDLKIKWTDISRINSRQLFTVRTIDGKIITGTIALEDGILVVSNNRLHKIPQDDLMTLIAGLESGANIWKGKVTFGANLSSGNTNKLEYNTNAELSRHTTASRIKTSYTAIIGETNNVQTDENHRFLATYDVYSDKDLFFRPLDFSFYRDPLQNINSRINVGMGIGYQFIDDGDQALEMNLGPSFLYTKYEYTDAQLNSSDESLAVSLTVDYEREIHDQIDFELSYKITATESETGGYLQNAKLNFDIELTDVLDFDISFFWDRVNNPQLDIDGIRLEKNDFRIAFGLGVSFN